MGKVWNKIKQKFTGLENEMQEDFLKNPIIADEIERAEESMRMDTLKIASTRPKCDTAADSPKT